jgi:hypothetical protein
MDRKQKVHFPFLDSTLLCCSLLDRQTSIFNVPLPQVKNGCESDLDGQVGKEKKHKSISQEPTGVLGASAFQW